MTTGEKIAKCRKERGLTQEGFAEYMDVSRQAVSKWESDRSFPETEKLIKMSGLFSCSIDYLLRDEPRPAGPEAQPAKPGPRARQYYTYKSSRVLFGLPLLAVDTNPRQVAKGIFTVGFRAKGIVSFGLISTGLISGGVLSAGLFSFGVVSLGLLLSLGAAAVGAVAFGAIAVGLLAFGALAVGEFAVGACAIGNYFAWGDWARGQIALGGSYARGSHYEYCAGIPGMPRGLGLQQVMQTNLTGFDLNGVSANLDLVVPGWLRPLAELIKQLL